MNRLTVALAGDELTYQVDTFRRFLLAQQFHEATINKHLGDQS